MAKEIIRAVDVCDSQKKYRFAQGTKVGNTIYLAGQVAWDEKGNLVGIGNYEAQQRQIFENIRRILAAAGAKMTDIVWILWMCVDIRDGIKNREFPAWREYFGDYEPPGTLIQVDNLAEPGMLLEVQVIAVVDTP